MKLHKITLYLADINNDSTLRDAKVEIENGVNNYFTLWFGKCDSKEIGEWGDNHKLNSTKIDIDKEWLTMFSDTKIKKTVTDKQHKEIMQREGTYKYNH